MTARAPVGRIYSIWGGVGAGRAARGVADAAVWATIEGLGRVVG
jgi:hypothetical protein